jgi:uncharacterized surface protein with fasciclin (FAS1) repeats
MHLSMRLLFPAMLALTLFLSACNKENTNGGDTPQTLSQMISAEAEFSSLAGALSAANLISTLSGSGPYTVFAPTNAAFQQAGLSNLSSLSQDSLSALLLGHVQEGNWEANLWSPGRVEPISEHPFYLSQDPSGDWYINGKSKIIQTDRKATNGVLHTLDGLVLGPQQTLLETLLEISEGPNPEFTQLMNALLRADFMDAIAGTTFKNITFFAPTDQAFLALYNQLGISSLQEIPVQELRDILRYHIVPVRRFSQDFREGMLFNTLLQESTLQVRLSNARINDARWLASWLNVHGTNGVMHGIDGVLLP